MRMWISRVANQVRNATFACLGYVLQVRSSNPKSYLSFQLNLAFELIEMSTLVQLMYMNWTKYKMAMLERTGLNWDTLTGADLVIGGLNFSMDFVWVKNATDKFFY
jgi:hypothetical protein